MDDYTSTQKGRVSPNSRGGGCHSSLGSSADISISHSGVSRGHRNVLIASVSHSSLGSSGDISISHSGISRGHRNALIASVNHYMTTPDSSGLRGPPNRTPLCSNGSSPPRPTSHSDMLNCAAPAHPQTISLHSGTLHNNLSELEYVSLHRTLPAQINHTIT